MKPLFCFFLLSGLVEMVFGQDLAIGTNRYEIVFEDASLPSVNRARFAADLSEAFSFETHPSTLFHMEETEEFSFGELQDDPYAEMYAFTKIVGGVCLTNLDRTVKCFVRKTLTDDHAGRLARYGTFGPELQSLDDLLASINDGTFSNRTFQAKLDCFWPAVAAPANPTFEQEADADAKLFSVLRTHTVCPPSIFRLESAKTSRGGSATLCGYCPFVSRTGHLESCMYIPVGFVAGKWRFFFGM